MAWLAELGVHVVDADQEARAVTSPGHPTHDLVVRRFGPAVAGPDGTLDRKALGRIVFADPAALRDLEQIVHPAVRPRILARIEAAEAAGAPAVVIEAIKLVEGGLAEPVRRGLAGDLRSGRPARAAHRARRVDRGGGPADRRPRRDLPARLAPAATRVLDTSAAPAATRAMVIEALGEAIAAQPIGTGDRAVHRPDPAAGRAAPGISRSA